jgi:hypothetical protein
VEITPEAGKGYAIVFSQKSTGVGTKNVFTNISLTSDGDEGDNTGGDTGGDSGDSNTPVSMWDLKDRTGVKRDDTGGAATKAREMKTGNYYYPDAYSGLMVAGNLVSLSDYQATDDALEFTISPAGGASASTLSAVGISVPLALEVGKTYTFTCQAASANMGVRLVEYTTNGDSWVYSKNTSICYNVTTLCTMDITPEAGKGYAINFSQKSAGVGAKNVFTNISLVEKQ